jgi:hypothetical protein
MKEFKESDFMTSAKIQAVLGSGIFDQRIYIGEIHYIQFYGKDKNPIFSDLPRTRFLFDNTNKILEVTFCRPYSYNIADIPNHGHYDILEYNGVQTVFEYLTDKDGNLIVDYYSFDSISTIVLRGV